MSGDYSLGEDCHLDPFRERVGRIRGDKLADQINFLINRWTKVVSDCEREISEARDASKYRSDYMDAHTDAIERLNRALDGDPDFLWTRAESLVRHLDEKRLSMMHENVRKHLEEVNDGDYYRTFAYSSGTRDALSYVVADLERVLSMTAEDYRVRI